MTALAVIGGLLGYAFIGGIVWQLVDRTEMDILAPPAALFWPLIVPVGVLVAVGYVVAYRAPRLAIEYATRPRLPRPKLPRAEVRK